MTTSITTVRASSLPLAFECPASVRPVEVRINPISEPANEGSAGHEVMRQIAESDARSLDGIDLGAIAARFGVDPDDLRPIAFNGLWIWGQIRESFRDAQGEMDLEATIGGIALTGHVDLISISGEVANLIDWKFGRVDRDYANQVKAYAALVLHRFPQVQKVSASIAWMREREIEPYSMTRAQLADWETGFLSTVVSWDGVFRPGPGCWKCPRSHACPAMTATVRRDVEALVGEDMAARMAEGLASLPDSEVVALHRRAKQIGKLIDSLTEAVKMRVDAAGGALPDGAGAELRFIEVQKRELDPQKAWPIVQAKLSDEELAGCLKISPSKLDDAIAAKAGRGKGAAAKRDLAAALEQAEAITTVPQRQLRDARAK